MWRDTNLMEEPHNLGQASSPAAASESLSCVLYRHYDVTSCTHSIRFG